MRTIKLYGDMGKRFGREFQMDVTSPAEAIRALSSQLDGFRAYLHLHAQDSFKVFVGGRNSSEDIYSPCSEREVICIAPVISGASAVGRIIIGALLVISTLIPMSPTFGNPYVMSMGLSMMLGGVVELLSPKAKISSSSSSSATNNPSYNFDGPVNTTAQGHPVSLAYGKLIVGSAVISAGMTT